jgi:hypothetical protein
VKKKEAAEMTEKKTKAFGDNRFVGTKNDTSKGKVNTTGKKALDSIKKNMSKTKK